MRPISIGTQLVATEGYKSLESGVTYYFLRSSPVTGRVLLLQLLERPARPAKSKARAKAKAKAGSKENPNSDSEGKSTKKRNVTLEPLPLLTALTREEFESGIGRSITRCKLQRKMPPWLDGLKGRNLSDFDKARKDPKRRHRERIDEKFAVIEPLVNSFEAVLDAPNPALVINQHARGTTKKLNETRVRLWFFCYLVFGFNKNALYYRTPKIGKWNRLTSKSTTKRGRPANQGKDHGYNVDADMDARTIRCYQKYAKRGRGMREVYIESMKSPEFGCRVRKIKVGNRIRTRIYHPEGKPFPSLKTFAFRVCRHFGRRQVQQTLHGKTRARSRLKPEVGSFAENTWNLMQRTETDATGIAELPKGYVDGSTLPPLYEYVQRDTASGAKTGIGFTPNSESSAGYRMTNFCAAIDKPRFCRLFGIIITADDWGTIGLSPADITDRGAGSTDGAFSRDQSLRPIIREMAPSNSGQGKAIVESSHPKTRSDDEAPSFVQSDLRTVELVGKRIRAVIEFNKTCDVSHLIAPELANDVSSETPNGLWSCLAARGRNDAVEVAFEDAVRNFLDKRPAKLSRKGVTFAGRLYRSSALELSAACESITGSKTLDIEVYVLEACIRHIWFDWNGVLIELDVCYPIPVLDTTLYMSLAEAAQYFEHSKRSRDLLREDGLGHDMEMRQTYERETGRQWDSTTRISGRPKRKTPTAKQEAAEARDGARRRKGQ